MPKAKRNPSSSDNQQIVDMILEFLNEVGVAGLTASLPRDRGQLSVWNYHVSDWTQDGSRVKQPIVMIDDVARRFFSLRESVYAILTKEKLKKGSIAISEKSVKAVLEQCVARFVWHSERGAGMQPQESVAKFLKEALLSQPRSHTVLVPVYGLHVNEPVEFRGSRYSRPVDCPEYVDRTSKIFDGVELGMADARGAELNSGFDVIVRVECKARFVDDAIHGAKEKVSRDLAVLRYSAYRAFREPPHLSVPGVVSWERKQHNLSTVAFDDRDQGVIQIAAFSTGATVPLNLKSWNESRWSSAVLTVHDISLSNDKSVASSLLDALTWLGRSTVQEDDATKLLFQITALESLLPLDGKDEKTHQVSLQTTVLGGMAGSSRSDTYELIKRAYGVRSAVVHGSRMTTSKYEPERVSRLLDRIVDFLLFDEKGKGLLGLSVDDFRMELMTKLFEQ
jgi:hypothetical protein